MAKNQLSSIEHIVVLMPDHGGGAHHSMPALETSDDYDAYIKHRTQEWKASRHPR